MAADISGLLRATFRWIDPGAQSTHLVSDLSGWWRDPRVLAGIGPALAEPFRSRQPTLVISPEMTGLLVGPLVAVALGVGFTPVVKGVPDDRGTAGDPPVPVDGRQIAESTSWVWTSPDHRGRQLTLGVRDRHLGPGDRVLVVDDWVQSGAQLLALRQLIRHRGATMVGASVLVADCPPELAHDLDLRYVLPASALGP